MALTKETRPSGARTAPLDCPRCGNEMNCHAVKIDTTLIPEEGSPDAGLGGVLQEFHTCRECRYVLEHRMW